MLWMQERQQLTGARNAEWVIIDANQATREKLLRPLVAVHQGHMVYAFREIAACPASNVNYPLVGPRIRQPYHLLDDLGGREIPRDIPIPNEVVDKVSARLRLPCEET